MHKNVFPDIPEFWEGTEEEWEDNCALGWCCNSINAMLPIYRVSDNPYDRVTAVYLERAQSVISFYVHERRRLSNDTNKTV